MILCDKRTKEQRLRICQACELYENGWCGTPMIGTLVDNPDGGRRKRSCGCKVGIKAELAFMECGHPFKKKWGKVGELDEDFLARCMDILERIGKNRISKKERHELIEVHSKAFGIPFRDTSCPSCLVKMKVELQNLIKRI